MNQFTFRYPEWKQIEPAAWLNFWASLWDGFDNDVRDELIAKQGKLSSEDLVRVGRWKEGCLTLSNGSWKTGTPKAYDVWMEASEGPLGRPAQGKLAPFLNEWSEKRFVAGKRGGKDLTHRFGLSRATTLLHFVSGGDYPILDRRVATAMSRLGVPIEEGTAGYESFCGSFTEIASACGVSGAKGLRKLDNALFNYGLFAEELVKDPGLR